MSDAVIRRVTDIEERIKVVYALGGYAFEPTPPLPDYERWAKWARNASDATTMAAFEGNQAMAMASSMPMTQNVRGRVMPMAGIWGVATHPAARRNGYVRDLMTSLLKSVREDGTPVSCLYPFRPSFYERMGYVTFPQPREAKIDPRPLLPLLKMDLGGSVELLPMAEGHAAYRAYLQSHQPRVHGMGLRSDNDARNEANNQVWVALARVDGEVQGAMIYKIEGTEDNFTMFVWRFYAHTIAGRYLLLEWFARHMDQVNKVQVRLGPDALPETWWTDISTLETSRVWPPMGRVVDVAGLGGLAVGEGAVTLQISDPLCPWNEGAWTFAGVDGALQVSPAQGAPDASLTIQALSGLVYGNHDPAMFSIRGWGEPSEAVQARMLALFPPLLPYLHEQF